MTQQTLTEKWAQVIDIEGVAPINESVRRATTAQLIENQAVALLNENMNGVAGVDNWSPILISMVRRIAPRLIAYDVCGVQPMSGPNSLIFCLKAKYANDPAKTQNDRSLPEAMGLDEVNAGYSGNGVANSGNTFGPTPTVRGTGMATTVGESAKWNAMGVSIEKTSVDAVTRQLRADYSQELAEDMRRIHNLSAEGELINILTNEITAELNREVLGKIYASAKVGSQFANTPGTFDLNTDSDGRWSVEKFKGLITAIEFDANQIALESRRGKGNKLFVSANVGTILAQSGVLDFAPALQASTSISVDPSGATYAGRLVGRYDVYVDPYADGEGYCVGYKGADQYDAGIFYCPYVPLQLYRAVNTDTFQNAIGFKTRYGIVANPFTSIANDSNTYYRKSIVTNLI